MLGKGPGIPADMVFLDLEDAVAPKEKEGARDKVVAAIRDQEWGEKVLCVRVNDWSTKCRGSPTARPAAQSHRRTVRHRSSWPAASRRRQRRGARPLGCGRGAL